MQVIFNAKTYDGCKEIEDLMKENYKQCIISIYTTMKMKLDLSLLKSIIVPEGYENGVCQHSCRIFYLHNKSFRS